MVIHHSDDAVGAYSASIPLLFTYPFTVITPLAGLGNAGALLYTVSLASKEGGVIEPVSVYLLGWLSVSVLIASMIIPLGFKYDGNHRFLFGHRYLTLHIKRMMTVHSAAS